MSLKCLQCSKCFSLAEKLRELERVHTGEKPYEYVNSVASVLAKQEP